MTGQIVLYVLRWQRPGRPEYQMGFPCEVLEERTLFGRHELLIRPVGGEGERWVSPDSCQFSE